MHPHLPNQTVLLHAQVEEGAHHSGYRKSRQGPSRLSKSEVPFACRLSPRLARRSRPPSAVWCFLPCASPTSGSNQITSITSIHRLLFSAVLPPPSPAASVLACSPHSVHENQLHQLDKGHGLYRTWSITQAHRRTRDQARQGKGQQSSAGKPAVSSRRRPVKRLPRARQGTSSCHLTVKSLGHLCTWALVAVSHTQKRRLRAARPRTTAPARQAKPSTHAAAAAQQAGPNPSNIRLA